MRSKGFEDAFAEVRLSEKARERIVEAALETEGNRGRSRSRFRPVRAAAAAALAVLVLAGTALAVSPGFRRLLWGGFEPYVQELESTPENTQVYDGVEARIVSALSDGYINTIHLELRDLEGDRVRDAWERFCETGESEFVDKVRFRSLVSMDPAPEEASLRDDGGFGWGGSDYMRGAVPIGFDQETGIMTLRLTRVTAAPLRYDRQVELEIDTGTVGTELKTEDHWVDDNWTHTVMDDRGNIISQNSGRGSGWTETLPGWKLTAALTTLPVRDADISGAEVKAVSADRLRPGEDDTMYMTEAHVSQLGVTLCREPDTWEEYREAPEELTVTLRDGTDFTLPGGYGEHFHCDFHVNDSGINSDTWLFPEPVDPDAVASVTLGGVEIQLD